MEKSQLDSYIKRLDQAFYITMKKLGPEISEHLESGLTSEQFFLLRLLNQKSEWTVSGLAEELQVRPSAITVMVDRMFKNDLLTRIRKEDDRRVVYIAITDKGQRALESSMKKRDEIIYRYMSQLTTQELESLVSIYEKLANIAQGSEPTESTSSEGEQ